MTALQFETACAEYDGQLVQPITVEDCKAIYDTLRPQLAAHVPLDVVIRQAPLRVDVTAGGSTRSIDVR